MKIDDKLNVIEREPRINTRRFILILMLFYNVGIHFLIFNSVMQFGLVLDRIKFYLLLDIIFNSVALYILNDLYNHYVAFSNDDNKKGLELIENGHFLCGNPLCSRCGGYYIGLGISSTVLVTFGVGIEQILVTRFSFSPHLSYTFILLGTILFIISTPLHGVLNHYYKRSINSSVLITLAINEKVKYYCGLVAGLSLSLLVVGGLLFFLN